jgi:hypothetical protein
MLEAMAMKDMQSWFASGWIADVVLLLMLTEGVLLAIFYRVTAMGPSPRLVWSNLLAGAALVMALRSALVGEGWQMTAVWLIVALAAHGFDLYLKLRN